MLKNMGFINNIYKYNWYSATYLLLGGGRFFLSLRVLESGLMAAPVWIVIFLFNKNERKNC
jgi:hypothetical protein